MTTRRNLYLIGRKPDQELVDVLTDLCDRAKRGEIIGLAYIAMKPGPGANYEGDVLGYIRKHRLLVRGIVDELRDLVANLNSRH